MSEGGNIKDTGEGVLKGLKRIWRIGHNDQRASWLAHMAVSLGVMSAGGLIGAILRNASFYAALGGSAVFLYFVVREVGDAYAHRKRGDWNELQDGPGSISARYDAWGDILGPLTTVLAAWLLHWIGLIR